jgi:hypothetical protein
MESFGSYLKANRDTGSKTLLRDFAASKSGWPVDDDEFGKYADFIVQNEADQAKRNELLSALANNYSSWKTPSQTWVQFLLSNIGLICLVLFGVIVAWILGSGIFSNESSFIGLIAKADQARGLITFLFSVTTIALFILTAITTFWMNADDVEARFGKAKDLLALMIGVFGTILGFYYGSLSSQSVTNPTALSLTNFGVPNVIVAPGDKTTVGATVTGGKLPLTYDIIFSDPAGSADSKNLSVRDQQIKDNKVAQSIPIPAAVKASQLNYVLVVHDANGEQTQAAGTLFVQPKPTQP